MTRNRTPFQALRRGPLVLLILLAGLLGSGCQGNGPAQDSQLARRKRNTEWTYSRITAREARTRHHLMWASGIMKRYLSGNPERAKATLEHILELD